MSSIYAARQRHRDAEYVSAYTKWLNGLTDAQRAKVSRMGIGKPSDPSHRASNTHDQVRDFDDNEAADVLQPTHEDSTLYRQAMSEALSELCHWFVMPPGQGGLNAKAIGQRVIMAMWVMRPDIIGNLSTTEIGALVDARPEVLSRQASAFSKRFGIRGRVQFSEKSRKTQSDSAKRRMACKAMEAASKPPSDLSRN